MFNWLILAAAVAFSLFVSLLARRLFEHHQHYRSVERIQRQIQMQQFFMQDYFRHRMMVEQGVITPNEALALIPRARQRDTETEMTDEASTPHDFYYKTNFDLSRDGRVYRNIPSNDIRLCSVCGTVIAHSAIQLHYNFAHPDWKPGVTMMAMQVREEKREQQNRDRAARMLEERRRWEAEQQERRQQQQARDIRVEVEQPRLRDLVRRNQMEDLERNAQSGVFIEEFGGRRIRVDPPQTLRDQVMSTRCVQCMRHLATLHDAWTAFDGTTPLCHECYRMREISENRQPVENRGATATLNAIDEMVRESIIAQLRETEPGT